MLNSIVTASCLLLTCALHHHLGNTHCQLENYRKPHFYMVTGSQLIPIITAPISIFNRQKCIFLHIQNINTNKIKSNAAYRIIKKHA